jgi:hypothetical protein
MKNSHKEELVVRLPSFLRCPTAIDEDFANVENVENVENLDIPSFLL